MELQELVLLDFRNFRESEARFTSGLNLIVGGNGQGKTNLLESVHLLAAGSSPRPGPITSCIRYTCDAAVVRSRWGGSERGYAVDAEIAAGRGLRMLVNKVPREKLTTPLRVSAVLFSPDDLWLVKGDPSGRRRFLDLLSAKLFPRAEDDRKQFERALRQRNGALKAAARNPRAAAALDEWDEQFVVAGGRVVTNRLKALELLGPAATLRYSQVSGTGQTPHLYYRSEWAEELAIDDAPRLLAEALSRSRSDDLARASGTVGPQRDDLILQIDGTQAKEFASQGEQRTLALSLRLAERDLIVSQRDLAPVLLLDDVFSELDESRRGQLAEVVGSSGQSIAAATESRLVPLAASHTLHVRAGEVGAA